jgi:hypothetical protein
MFRQRVGAQTAITVQQALPSIVVSMIAVTFSYAIAGFLIDLMYLTMFLVANVFQASGVIGADMNKIDGNIVYLAMKMFGQQGPTRQVMEALVSSLMSDLVGSAEWVFAFFGGITFAVVFALALLFSIFRLFFDLLRIYITVVINIIVSPVILMMGALPGNNAFKSWIKTIVFNLAVFPTILVALFISATLTSQDYSQKGGFMPPYLLGSGVGGALPALVGMGILLVMPEIVGKVKSMAGKGPFDEFAGHVGNALKKGWTGGELVPGAAWSNTNTLPLLKQMGGLSGSNAAKKTISFGSGLAGAVTGGIQSGFSASSELGKGFAERNPERRREHFASGFSEVKNAGQSVVQGFKGWSAGAARNTEDKTWFPSWQKELEPKENKK